MNDLDWEFRQLNEVLSEIEGFEMIHEVVIVGAGAAGLGAASYARSLGLDYKVIEATSRVGGRAMTTELASGQPFDLGCHWLQGGERNPFHPFVDTQTKLGTLVLNHAFWRHGTFASDAQSHKLNDAFDTLYTLHLENQNRWTKTGSKDEPSIRDALSSHLDFEEDYFRLLTHECAAAPELVSISDPAGINFGGDDIPVLSGYGRLIERASGVLDVTLNCPATVIDLSGADILVDTSRGTLRARHVILTVSTAVLAREHISFGSNGLPNWKLSAIDAVPTGSSTKVGLQFEPGTLAHLGLEGNDLPGPDQLVIMQRDDTRNGSWHLATGDGDLCTCYIGGEFSYELATAGKLAQVAWARDDLTKILGSAAMEAVVAAEATPFDRIETLGGGYSYLKVGYPDARNALEKPVEDRLFFAGEACADVDATTAHGAWNSGVRAVDQIHSLRG